MAIDYVVSVQDGLIKVVCSSRACRDTVRGLGGRRSWLGQHWKIPCTAENVEIARIFGELRKGGVAFAGGTSGWPPSEIFRDLRDKGVLTGPFFEVVWTGPGEGNACVREV